MQVRSRIIYEEDGSRKLHPLCSLHLAPCTLPPALRPTPQRLTPKVTHLIPHTANPTSKLHLKFQYNHHKTINYV